MLIDGGEIIFTPNTVHLYVRETKWQKFKSAIGLPSTVRKLSDDLRIYWDGNKFRSMPISSRSPQESV